MKAIISTLFGLNIYLLRSLIFRGVWEPFALINKTCFSGIRSLFDAAALRSLQPLWYSQNNNDTMLNLRNLFLKDCL